ncbi:MAG: hypothetical protein M3Q44_02145 [bacterium]|nr:hypothetical protein [bacterium]
MKIVEQFIESKTGRIETCEDAIYADDNFIAIVDGVSSKTDKKWNNKTPGQIAVNCIIDCIPTIDPNAEAFEFFSACNSSIHNWYDTNTITIEMAYHINHRCGASMIVYSQAKRQLWIIGSGLAIIGTEYINSPLLIEDICSQVRSYFIQSEIIRGVPEEELKILDTGREYIKPLLVRQIMFQNSDIPSDFNFYVIDGFFKNPQGVQIADIPENLKEIVIASDGYPEIFDSLDKTELFLKNVIKDDPLCYKRYKTTKGVQQGNISFDDRSYVKISLENK